MRLPRRIAIILALTALMCMCLPTYVVAETASPSISPTIAPTDTPTPAQSELPVPEIEAVSAVLVDALTGNVLLQLNPDEKRYPASITKIMTCLLALEKGTLSDEVTMTNAVYDIESDATHCGLVVGEVMTLEQLIYAMMLGSANDAANAIAVHIAGSISAFAEMMNQKAQDLNMTNTQFKNPNGLHNDEHYTTATDMAILTREALKNEKFAQIVSTLRYEIAPTEKTDETRYFINTNRLIHADMNEPFYYEYATGVKTGYTLKAGQTLVASAVMDNTSLIAVVLGDSKDGKWTDCKKLFEYGFARYVSFNMLDLVKQIEISVDIPNAAADDPFSGNLILTPEAKGSEYITSTREMARQLSSSANNIEVNYLTDLSILRAPLDQGVAVGEVQYLVGGQVVLEARLLTSRIIAENTESVTITPSPDGVGASGEKALSPVLKFILTFLIVLSSLTALLFILRFIVRLNNKRRRARRRHTQYRPPYRFK